MGYFNPRTPCGVRPDANSEALFSSNFNPRTPCGVRLSERRAVKPPRAHFNPRTPCGVRQVCLTSSSTNSSFQSTHPLRGATQYRRREGVHAKISIHAPHAGCDKPVQYLSARFVPISIHAPHAGCDLFDGQGRRCGQNFNPRTPCGVRLAVTWNIAVIMPFQSTHPMRGATRARRAGMGGLYISIHAPHAGCDHGRYFDPDEF